MFLRFSWCAECVVFAYRFLRPAVRWLYHSMSAKRSFQRTSFWGQTLKPAWLFCIASSGSFLPHASFLPLLSWLFSAGRQQETYSKFLSVRSGAYVLFFSDGPEIWTEWGISSAYQIKFVKAWILPFTSLTVQWRTADIFGRSDVFTFSS